MIRGAYGLISRRGVDRLAHHVEDGQPRATGLLQRGGEHRGRDAVQLGVQLQRGDDILGPGDLEVHVTERVLGAEDVGQRDVLAALVDQAHRDARHHVLQRHARIEQRHRGRADRAHGGGAVGADGLGYLPDRVGELLAGRQHRDQRPLGQRAVADLAPLGRADPAGLAGGVRRHVVVVHVALGALRVERVDHLLHPEHVQRGDAQDLGLAPLEQRRAVHPGQHARLGGQLPDVGQAAAVDAQARRG